jgi:hypothetical protein
MRKTLNGLRQRYSQQGAFHQFYYLSVRPRKSLYETSRSFVLFKCEMKCEKLCPFETWTFARFATDDSKLANLWRRSRWGTAPKKASVFTFMFT